MSQHQLVTRIVPRPPRDDPGNKAQRAWENRAHVRRALGERQPEFARALAAAVRDLSGQGPGLPQRGRCPICGKTRVPFA
jgi:hypothetical protein